jgi:ATP-dependent DNA ligase
MKACRKGQEWCRPKFNPAIEDQVGAVEHAEGDSDELFQAACNLGLEGIVSKRVDAPYRTGPSKAWVKVKNPDAPAATRAIDGTF